jgi:hypothetical protein
MRTGRFSGEGQAHERTERQRGDQGSNAGHTRSARKDWGQQPVEWEHRGALDGRWGQGNTRGGMESDQGGVLGTGKSWGTARRSGGRRTGGVE